MAVPKIMVEFTPVVAPRGQVVHATTLAAPNRTACGKKFSRWAIALKPLSCRDCKLAVFRDCRKKPRP